MGSFSWVRAENTTKRANITIGDTYKILVPAEFGGGYIKDTYYDYGEINHYVSSIAVYVDGNGTEHREFPKNDLYGILAYWNGCEVVPEKSYNPKSMIDILLHGCTEDEDNRAKGIDIGCYDNEVDKLKYPLKLVSPSYKGTYEDCKGRSYTDPNQGFSKGYWYRPSGYFDLDYAKYYNKLKYLNNIEGDN